MPVRDTKGSHLSRRHCPVKVDIWSAAGSRHITQAAQAALAEGNLYTLLRVDEECTEAELKAAYRQRALEEHPDKGGDQARFDELSRAYAVLENAEKRDAYDADLSEARSRARLVEGGPAKPRDEEKAKTDLTKKTAPHVGSNRNKDWHKCSAQWKGETSGIVMVQQIRLAIADAQGAEGSGAPMAPGAPMAQKDLAKKAEEIAKEQTEALFEKFITLNPGSKKMWLSTLSGKQKKALEAYGKVQQAKDMEKAKQWLTSGPKERGAGKK